MTAKPNIESRLQFSTSEAWQAYVRDSVPPTERRYVLAFGLVELYLQFYEVRNQSIPARFVEEFDRIKELNEPDRTEALENLSGSIFADTTRLLMSAMPSSRQTPAVESPRKIAEGLLRDLESESPAFAVWAGYKRVQGQQLRLPTWEEYVHSLLDGESSEELESVLLMGQLGELLYQFRDRNLALPTLAPQRILAVEHESAGKVRNFAARMLVQELLEEIPLCTSA